MSSIKVRHIGAVLLTISCFLPVYAMAQSQAAAATVSGYVYDPAGAVVPEAQVTAVNTGTNYTRSTKTGADGHFLIPALPPGTYTVTIVKQGFGESRLENVILRVGDALNLEGNLKPAQIMEETIVIAENNPIIETTRTQPGTVIERNLIDALPLNGRNWTELVLLTPGVTNDGEFGNVSFGGVDRVFNNVQVDGADNNNSFFGEIRGRTRAPFQFSQETVQEFRVANNNFSAEFGRAAGGIVNAITRSGSNAWRGSAFYYLRDDLFNANNFFNNSNGIPRPSERRQQFGGNIGGPIVRDKVFLFFNYDQQVRSEPYSVILGTRLENEILALAPAQRAQAEALLRPFVRSVPRDFNQINFFPRVDWNINANHNLSVTHNFQRFSSFNGLETRPTTLSNDTGNGKNFTNSYTTVFTINSVFSPSLVNEFRYNLVFDDTGDRGTAPQLPRISFSGFDMGGNTLLQNSSDGFPGRFTYERKHQFVDNFSILRSKHTIKLGFDILRVSDLNLFAQNTNGSYSFTDVTSFLTNSLSSYSQRYFVGSPIVSQRTLQYGIYAQDQYRVGSRVTIYYGIRYELQTLPKPLISNPLEPLTARINVDKNNVEPRFGFAISPTKDAKTVIRGGYGIFHGLTPNLLINDFLTRNNAYAFDIFLSGDTLISNGIVFPPISQLNILNLAQTTFPRLSSPPGGISFANPTGDLTVSAPDRVNPYSQMGNLEIERELPGKVTISAAYLVTRGVHIGRARNINIGPATGTATLGMLNTSGQIVQTMTFPRIGANFAALRPNPNFRQILMVESAANSIYHALAMKVNRRFGNGFTLLGSYTLSKNIDDIRNSLGGFSEILDPYNARLDRGLSALDQRHRLVISGVWDMPFFRTAGSAFTRHALGGWSVSGIGTIASGRPVGAEVNGLTSSTTDTDFNEDNVLFDRVPFFGRNTFTGPDRPNLDLSLRKSFQIDEKRRVKFMAQGFNVFNHPLFTTVVNTAYDARRSGGTATRVFTVTPRTDFLQPTAALRGRDIQFGVKFSY